MCHVWRFSLMNTSHTWSAFYDAVAHRPPHDTLLKALALFDGGPERERFAIDLGCGSGRDTLEMLRRSWRVLAIDREPEGLARLVDAAPITSKPRLTTRATAFEAIASLPPCDFVNASFSLPFCAPAHFDVLWQAIVRAIQPRGRFAGTLFGINDEWAHDTTMTFHMRDQVDAMLAPLKVEQLLEHERDGVTATGAQKHWHVFHVVAFKR
jgi:SAM-dependent methyltransferase